VGTGIGLFVAKQFVEGHGGKIEIESRQNVEDHGTTVRVFLPISTEYDSSGEGARQGSNGQLNAEDVRASVSTTAAPVPNSAKKEDEANAALGPRQIRLIGAI
jgi:hypothetical protein